jgi:thiol-disulfide isomerase/thioredoxin
MRKKTLFVAIVFIIAVLMTVGCRSTSETPGSDVKAGDVLALGDSGFVETDTALTSEDFAKNKLTVLNVWATWCPPCVAELPELQKISEAYKDKGVEIIGVLQDGLTESGLPSDAVIKAANVLMRDADANYRIILPDEYLQTEFIDSMQYFPTTFFLDANGTAVKTVIGSNDYESWERLIDEALKKLED